MNVKPGDLAIVIKCSPEQIKWLGRIVIVIRQNNYFGIDSDWEIEFDGPSPESPFATLIAGDDDLRKICDLPLQKNVKTDIKLLA